MVQQCIITIRNTIPILPKDILQQTVHNLKTTHSKDKCYEPTDALGPAKTFLLFRRIETPSSFSIFVFSNYIKSYSVYTNFHAKLNAFGGLVNDTEKMSIHNV